MVVSIFPVKSPIIINFGDDALEQFFKGLKHEKISIKNNDIIAVSSKVLSMQQKSAVELNSVKPTTQALEIAKEASMDPRIAQLVINESGGKVIGQVFHAILAKTPYGLSANAGIDLSNCPEGWALLLPINPNLEAEKIRQSIKEKLNVDVAVIITDSRTIPLRRGTTAVAIGIAGMEPVIDERGNKDLYGYEMTISTRAVADTAATCANSVMGETNERIPFAIVRGLGYNKGENQTMLSALMPEDQCLYFAPILKLSMKKD